jgi:PAS domain S-box-containing protein
MISYASKLAEYFRYSNRFYYLMIDLQGKFSYVNPAFQDQFNFLSSNFKGGQANNLSVFGENQVATVLHHCIQHPYIPVTTQINMQTLNGFYKTIQWEFSAIIDENGKTNSIQAIGVNIAENKKEIVVDHNLEELRYQAAILENVSDIIISCTLEHKIRSWNKSAEIFYNIKADDAIGKAITDIVKIDYPSTTREQAHKEFYEKSKWKGEVTYHKPGGEKKYLFNSLSFVTNESGDRIGIMVIGKDITDQKKAEENLKQSELFYRNLFADSLDGILLADEKGDLHFCSASANKILGYESDEIIGRNTFEFVHPDDRKLATDAFMNEVTETPEVKFIVVRLLKKSGEWLWCMVRGHNLLHNPHIGRVAIYFYDDSLRKQAEDALRETEQRFSRLISELKFGVVMRDAEGRPILCNKTVLEFSDFTEEEFMRSNFHSNGITFIGEDGKEIPLDNHPYIIATKTKKPVRDVVLGAYRKNKKKPAWLLISSDPVLNDEGDLLHVITTFIDITERREWEESLTKEKIKKQKIINKATVEAQEKERKQIGKELHDNIGQQLTTTKLYLDIVKENTEGAEHKLVLQASKSITDIINEIRNLSRALTPSALNDLGLIESVRDLCESIKTTQAFAIRFYHKHFDEENLAEDIKLMLFRIIQEQINNIIKHAEATAILIRLQMDAEQLILTITDNGKGFNVTSIKKGLGIDNMVNRADIFNGKLDLKTEPGKGCSITVTIPINKD